MPSFNANSYLGYPPLNPYKRIQIFSTDFLCGAWVAWTGVSLRNPDTMYMFITYMENIQRGKLVK